MAGHRDDPVHRHNDDELRIRPYTVTNGRTRPSTELDLVSLVRSTGQGVLRPDQLNYDHAQALRLCHTDVSVAEIAAHLRQTLTVAKILLSDLIELGLVTTQPPALDGHQNDPEILEAVLAGLRGLRGL